MTYTNGSTVVEHYTNGDQTNGVHTNGHHSNGVQSNGHGPPKSDVSVDTIAISPNAPDAVPALIDQIASHKSISLENSEERLRLRDAARSLANALETPREAIVRQCWTTATLHAAIETALAMGVFNELSRNKPKSVTELAAITQTDPVLLSRIMKHLASMNVITEAGPDEYIATNLSITLSVERYGDAFPALSGWLYPGIYAIPTFLKETGFRNPTDPTKSPFQLGQRVDEHFFECVQKNPTLNKQFGNHMSAYHQGRPSWMDKGFYPVWERLVEGIELSEKDVFLVDVGSSTGHDVSEFRRKWPEVPGRLVVQDLPQVIETVRDLHGSITPMAHNFFTEQPVKGARVYYMHSVLHDWPDDVCGQILSNLIPAMRPGYSKLLINEYVVPSLDAHFETTSLDMIMMSIASGERTEKHWTTLIESAGLKVVKIWTVQKGVESLIECELA
ncbi:hypothetical protein AbraIFM66951_010240 [Aspergillus brasiliensis]|uniref:O-methyltransferase domain-containing protein n=1 Tax=Aspergillus brasiliensis TaxID=319629 RepID=A0A9W5YVZ3_9EURO|nr:hypothetical protein AbraCBS73388_010599 [Aspergillus brasiliensis]GKZ41512.1 hypothetical protein AbraIFM66951_010240 [Aspergillus brasiliensis]